VACWLPSIIPQLMEYSQDLELWTLGIFPYIGIKRCSSVFTRTCPLSLSWDKWIHSVPSYPISLRSISCNIVLPSTLTYSKCPPSLKFSHQDDVCIFSHACYMSPSSYPPWFNHCNNIWQGPQIMKHLIMQFSPVSSSSLADHNNHIFGAVILKRQFLEGR
jgi:hypothetical protein